MKEEGSVVTHEHASYLYPVCEQRQPAGVAIAIPIEKLRILGVERGVNVYGLDATPVPMPQGSQSMVALALEQDSVEQVVYIIEMREQPPLEVLAEVPGVDDKVRVFLPDDRRSCRPRQLYLVERVPLSTLVRGV